MEIATLIALARNDNFMIYSSFPFSAFRFPLFFIIFARNFERK